MKESTRCQNQFGKDTTFPHIVRRRFDEKNPFIQILIPLKIFNSSANQQPVSTERLDCDGLSTISNITGVLGITYCGLNDEVDEATLDEGHEPINVGESLIRGAKLPNYERVDLCGPTRPYNELGW